MARARGPFLPLVTLAGVMGSAVLSAHCGGDDPPYDQSWRVPCDGRSDWDPAAPLLMNWTGYTAVDPHLNGFVEHLHLADATGAEVNLLLSARAGGLVIACPAGGLSPDTTYTWTIDRFEESWNHLDPRDGGPYGTTSFTTGPTSEAAPTTSQAGCDAYAVPTVLGTAADQDCDTCTRDTALDDDCRELWDAGALPW